MSNHIYIDGFGLAGYRSFGDEVQRIAPCQKINLLVGQNNSGKSNILLFLYEHYRNFIQSSSSQFKDIDYHRLNNSYKSSQVIFQRAHTINKCVDNLLSKDTKVSDNHRTRLEKKLEPIYRCLADNNILVWFPLIIDGQLLELNKQEFDEKEIGNIVNFLVKQSLFHSNEWKELWQLLESYLFWKNEREIFYDVCILNTIRVINNDRPKTIPLITLIPAIRKIGEAGSEFQDDDFSGQGIIDRLAQLQNPSYSQQILKDKFEQINQFLRTVTGNESATLEIPYERNMINVHIDNKTLPLSSLGTGIHEVIILAAAATILENQVICIEEPELHLHPILQKKLIRYLQEKTTNQYFITTHSAHFLDTPEVAIFHITLENGQSKIECVSSNSKKSQICADLGYRPSDLLQANCIIWVEGPSDRIYLNHWLKLVDPNLLEGIHYSIMFYGGKLLSHLSASDTDENDSEIDNNEQVEEFISLSSLNHNIAMIIDSDKENENSEINKTKQRLAAELNNNNNFVWITKGREIENYINPEILQNAIAFIHPRLSQNYTRKEDNYDNCLVFWNHDTKTDTTADKVKVARKVVETQTKEDLSRLDLENRLNELVDFINKANGIQPH